MSININNSCNYNIYIIVITLLLLFVVFCLYLLYNLYYCKNKNNSLHTNFEIYHPASL